jgi:hypothetical protein
MRARISRGPKGSAVRIPIFLCPIPSRPRMKLAAVVVFVQPC